MPSLRARNILNRPARKDVRREVKEKKEMPSAGAAERPQLSSQPWAPSGYTAFKALMSARLCAAIWMHIADCDETYNYWEPTHYLLYGKGFQTWEYSPVYAIRSYAYLWLHALPLKLYVALFSVNKLIIFYFLRLLLCLICALCEMYFYKGVCRHFGANTGRLTLWVLALSTGMYVACGAYLPSTFAMYMTLVSMGAWFQQQYQVAIFVTAASTILGWPFAAIIGIPLAVDLFVLRKKVSYFLKWSLLAGLTCLIPVVWIDSTFYGKLVVTPLNIVLYNIFSTHGPNIYGVESWSFYFLNGFLNFNIAFVAALLVVVIVPVTKFMIGCKYKSDGWGAAVPIWLVFLGMYLWIIIFFTRPHKEERFLFPIYPLVALAAAVSLDFLQKLYCHVFVHVQTVFSHYTDYSNWLPITFLTLFSFLSLSRSYMLYTSYHGSMDAYLELHKLADNPDLHQLAPDQNVNVCVGKEWYRFPGNLFLYDDNWHLQFIKSDFKGQLPKPYSNLPNATTLVPSHMNDLNLEEPSRYVDVSQCHYLVDLESASETLHEVNYSQQTAQWTKIASVKFLDPARSHRLYRAFYVPYLTEANVIFADYNVLRSNTRMRAKRPQKKDAKS